MLKKVWSNYRFQLVLICSIFIGSILGIIFKEKTNNIAFIGQIFINLLFIIVVPLVFSTISSSIANISSIKRLGRIMKYMIIIFIITSLISSIVMLIGVLIFKPSGSIIESLEYTTSNINITDRIVSMLTVSEFYELLSKSNMLPLIIFSIIFGISIKLCGKETIIVSNFLNSLSKVMIKMITVIMFLAPIGLCSYFASLVGTYGIEILGSYFKCFIIYLVMAIIYYLIFYSLYTYIAYRKEGVKVFYKNILLSTITSLGTCSSLATLPSNIKTCDNMNIDKEVSKLVLPIGASIHMEGSSMASILKIAFLFSIFGRPFNGITDIMLAIVVALLSSVVMSGIPGGAMIGEMLIVSIYNFPSSAFAVIATLGWIIDSPGTCLNAVGDIPSCMLISKYVNKENINYS